MAMMFPWRACWAIWNLTWRLKANSFKPSRGRSPNRGSKLLSVEQVSRSPSSSGSDIRSLSSTTTLTEYDADAEFEEDQVIHAIIIPNYKEDLETMRETLDVLASHMLARSSYDVYLATEQGETGAYGKAAVLIEEFLKSFRTIDYTMHPRGIPGEAQGKSSNVKWAAQIASDRYKESPNKDNVVFIVMDSDSHLSTNYFAHIGRMHLAYPETASTTLYASPIVFDRNSQEVPFLVRIADLAWSTGGLSGLYTTSAIRPPTSVYSLPLSLADLVGGWDAGPESIGEDLHMYLKCFFALRGHLTTRTVHAPISQSNVTCDGHGMGAFIGNHRARYKQALRHMWGALDSSYAVQEAWALFSEREAASSLLTPHGTPSPDSPKPRYEYTVPERSHYLNVFLVFHRLYEAHFLPAHLFVFIVSSAAYNFFVPINSQPADFIWLLNITGYIRAFAFASILLALIMHERYHAICIRSRELEMRHAGLYDVMVSTPGGFSHRSLKKNLLDYLLFPIGGMIFGSIPSIHAQICQLWTLDLAYSVSKKPTKIKKGDELV
ncbi:hypothetical protein AJ80_03826 [Polytolypa hystricis UAMH7299]|uniref:Glycosyltransferase 2-like domain-containing protein n=1 Tax=Polytolypa hystricis (strain UAMH7299) TaxID=1447883 RepID=A0A2B7YF42_POLH7|nr:hypothetical protein AJ80_03826 [Polytolypa hystricis UAMH7299]